MKSLFQFTVLVFLVVLIFNEASAADDEFNAADCVITVIEPQFDLIKTEYKMGGLCNGALSFRLFIRWRHGTGSVSEYFDSEQYGGGDLHATCPQDPVLFDGRCTSVSLFGIYKKIGKLVSRDRLTQEQRALLLEEFNSLVPSPSIDSPEAGEFFGEQYRVADTQFRIPLRLTIFEPAVNLKFKLLAMVSDDSGQVSMQEVLTKKTTYNFFFLNEEEALYESSILLPAGIYSLRASSRTTFLFSGESITNFTVGDRAKMREALSVKELRKQIEIPVELASSAVNPDRATIARVSGAPQISQAAIQPTSRKFTVISPKPGVRYTTAPVLKVFLPARDDVLYALIQCAGPDQQQPCDHHEGGIAAADLSCAHDDVQCSAEVPFGFEMPLEKSYWLYVRPDSSTDLVEVNFELGAIAEQLTPQPMARSPVVSKNEMSRARVATGVVVASIEQLTDPLKAGQPIDLKVWLKNMGTVKSDAGLKYSVVCKVRAGGGECPFKDAAYTVNTPIDPDARHAVKLSGSAAGAGTYAITVAAPLPEKGEPFSGNSVTRTIEVEPAGPAIERPAIKRTSTPYKQP